MIEEEKDIEQVDEFDLNAVFNDVYKVDTQHIQSSVKKKEPIKEVAEEPVKQQPSVEQDEDDIISDKPKLETKVKEIDYKNEFERVQKTLKDTQRSFHEDRQKLAAYKRAVEKLKEDGSLLDEEASLLLDHTKFESEPENVLDEPVLVRYGKVWDKELEYMKKYALDASEINQHIMAFQHLIQSSSQRERDEIFEELSHYEEDEVKLTKHMLQIGRQYNDDIYSDIAESGSIRKLKAKYSEKEVEMQKEIDKWKKRHDKLKEKHEDYDSDPGNYKLPQGSVKHELQDDSTFDIASILNR